MARPEEDPTYPPPSGVHKDCKLCEEHFLSVEAQKKRRRCSFNDDQAQELLIMSRENTKERLRHVSSLLQTHGDIILARWRKYKPEKRTKLLGKASNIFLMNSDSHIEKQRSDPWGLVRPLEPRMRWLDRLAFAQDSMQLLSLMHVRTKYEPHQWAVFDTRSGLLNFMSYSNSYGYNSRAVVMHGERYGSMTESRADSLHSWETIGWPRAMLTFNAQFYIADMLSKIVDLLVAGSDPSGDCKWTALVAAGLHSAHDDALWSPYHHQEFTAPSSFDPDALLEKAQNHLNVLVDETELLQTSPEHLHHYVMEIKASTLFFQEFNEVSMSADQQWTRIAHDLAYRGANGLFLWQRIVLEIENIQQKLNGSRHSLATGGRLTKEADTALRCFGRLISCTLDRQTCDLYAQLKYFAGMQDHFVRSRRLKAHRDAEGLLNPQRQDDRIAIASPRLADAVEEDNDGSWEIAWWIQKMRNELHGVPYNQWFENCLSGIALADELHVAWKWRQTTDYGDPLSLAALKVDMRTRDMCSAEPDRKLQEKVDRTSSGGVQCGKLLQAFCESPLPRGPKNLEWLERMQESRKRLTDFWDCVRTTWVARQRSIERTEQFQAKLLSMMSFDKSPAHLAEVEKERQRLEADDARMKAHRKQKKANARFVQQDWDLGGKEDGTAVHRNMTKKAKAASKETEVHDDLQQLSLARSAVTADPAEPEPKSSPTIAVKQETLNVISKMFPLGEDGSKAVRWNTLVQALGFLTLKTS